MDYITCSLNSLGAELDVIMFAHATQTVSRCRDPLFQVDKNIKVSYGD